MNIQEKLEALKEINYYEKRRWFESAGELYEKIGDEKKANEMFRKAIKKYEKK